MKLLPEDMYRELEDALGEENVSQHPAVLDGYAWQPIFSLTSDKWIPRPAAVVLHGLKPEKVDKLAKYIASLEKIPLIVSKLPDEKRLLEKLRELRT